MATVERPAATMSEEQRHRLEERVARRAFAPA
jgi:hypothetical protein